jgi:hypothetical protein
MLLQDLGIPVLSISPVYLCYVLGGVVLPAPLHLEVDGGRKDLPSHPGSGYAQPGGKLWHRGKEVRLYPGFESGWGKICHLTQDLDMPSLEESSGTEGKR